MRKVLPAITLIAFVLGAHEVNAAPRCSRKCDTTKPSISIASPVANAVVAGSVSVGGTASDNASVARTEVSVDGGGWVLAQGTTSWTHAWDSTAVADGTHTIAARATDGAGNVATASVSLTVGNAPARAPEPSPSPSPSPSPGPPVDAPALPPGSIGGWTFTDANRDGVYETGETPLANQHLYLFDGAGAYLANTYSNASGWYTFAGREDGAYRIDYASDSWWTIRRDLAPTTTGAVRPSIAVTLSGTARADFGWRPIVRSTDANAPISSYTAPNGLVVQSYDDVVAARTLYESLLTGSLVGAEAATTTIRFDLSASGSAATMATQTDGRYTYYHATCYVPYLSWLDSAERGLFHEYGHAWSLYYAYLVRQDPTLSEYLRVRGLEGDARVGTSYAWDVKELIAEDYRQLFAPAQIASGQVNAELPLAKDVPGLREYLSGAFMQP
jgi:hypothetical protein